MASASKPSRQELVAAMNVRVEAGARAVAGSAMALASHGVDQEQFGLVIREALLNNPQIITADERSIAQAVRRCCRDLIIPDGDRGAIVLFGNEAAAIPMVAGLEQMVIEEVDAEIRSGVVYEGDNVRVIEGINPDIQIITDGMAVFKQRKGESVIGAWCWLKFPWEDTARLVLYSLDDINRSMMASRAKNGPWKTWKDRMARKACVKSAIWQHRAMIRSHGKGSRLLRIIEEDTALEYGETQVEDALAGVDVTTIEGTAVEAEAAPEPEKDPPKPRRQRNKPKQAEQDAANAAASTATAQAAETEKAEPAQETGGETQETGGQVQQTDPPAQQEQAGGQPDPDPDDPGHTDDGGGFLPLGKQGGGSAFDDDDDDDDDTRL